VSIKENSRKKTLACEDSEDERKRTTEEISKQH